jgi:hypothetical protein
MGRYITIHHACYFKSHKDSEPYLYSILRQLYFSYPCLLPIVKETIFLFGLFTIRRGNGESRLLNPYALQYCLVATSQFNQTNVRANQLNE